MKTILGIDVGTGSARAGLFDEAGRMLACETAPLDLIRTGEDRAEYRSAQIWEAVSKASRGAITAASAEGSVAGIGVDATCSLVVEGGGGVSDRGEASIDTIAWLDHRAIRDAAAIDATGADVLAYVGGTISAEMQIPKLRWLFRHWPDRMAGAEFFDLPDWLTYRATGSRIRSLCSVVCKWLYQGQMGHAGEGWDTQFLDHIGLGGLAARDFAAIGRRFRRPGMPVGGVSEQAATELGVAPGTPVAASLIDAYAGALGALYAGGQSPGRLSLIAGTSACHVALTERPVFVSGVWGPYHEVMFAGQWALEAGQSAAGALLDRLIEGHGSYPALRAEARDSARTVHELLEARLAALAGGNDTHRLTANLHVQPDFHGNRAPLADPHRRGAVSGLTLESGTNDLARLYLAGIQALAHGTRQIVTSMADSGLEIRELVVTGGLAKSALYRREHADITGLPVILPQSVEPVLLGAAMLGRAAYEEGGLPGAMEAMSGPATRTTPRAETRAFHDAKHRVFLRMQDDFAAYAMEMQSA